MPDPMTKRVLDLLPAVAAGVLLGDLAAGSIPIVGIAIAYIAGDIVWQVLRKAFPRTDDRTKRRAYDVVTRGGKQPPCPPPPPKGQAKPPSPKGKA